MSHSPRQHGPRRPKAARPSGGEGVASGPSNRRSSHEDSREPDAGPIAIQLTTDDAICDGCRERLDRDQLFVRHGSHGHCIECADMGHLVFLPRGDAALTRRSTKHSTLSAVVVRWNRRRKRYERQGTLVEEEGLAKAEAECLADADVRARKRDRDAIRRERLDATFVATFAARVRERFPNAPKDTDVTVAEHACLKGSGRVGRTAAAKEFEPDMIDLAVRAHIRHVHTPYDTLLAKGTGRDTAREIVGDLVDAITREWRG